MPSINTKIRFFFEPFSSTVFFDNFVFTDRVTVSFVRKYNVASPVTPDEILYPVSVFATCLYCIFIPLTKMTELSAGISSLLSVIFPLLQVVLITGYFANIPTILYCDIEDNKL